MSKLDEIKNFLSADHEEIEKRYRKRMGYTDDEPTEEDMEAPAEESVEEVFAEETRLEDENIDEYEDDNEYESSDYSYTEETAYLRGDPELIDKKPRQDEEIFKLSKPKTVSEIEGNIEVEDKKRGIVFTSYYNKKGRYHFNRLYDVSGEKPVLLASGDVDYKDGMFIVHYPNKQSVDDRGDYLKYMQSALYKLDKSNKPHFVAANVVEILNDGWFEQSSGKDYSVYLCKDENDGKYRRVMNFGADMSGHREVTADGTIIDELDRTDWYHKDEYKYDAKKHTLKFVKGEGYELDDYDYNENDEYQSIQISSDIEVRVVPVKTNGQEDGYEITFRDTNEGARYSEYDYEKDELAFLRSESNDVKSFYSYNGDVLTINDYNNGIIKTIDCFRNENGNFSIQEKPMDIGERKKGYERLYWDFVDTKYGTFFRHQSKYSGGTFVKTDGTQDTTFSGGGLYNQISVNTILPNGLAKISGTTYSAHGFGNWGRESKCIYDFKTSAYREDLEDIRELGDKFYAAKKNGEDKFGIYEMADEDMKNPLIMVDDCKLIRRTGVAYRDIKELDTDIILFSVGDTKCRCEITPEGKLKPIAKQKNDKELYLSTGSQWVKVDLPEDAKVHIREEAISIDRWTSNGGYCDLIYLSSTDALEFARSIAKTSQKEKIKEQPQETYYNAKERLIKHIAETKAMTADIEEGMTKTKESGYKHISRTPTPNKGGRED